MFTIHFKVIFTSLLQVEANHDTVYVFKLCLNYIKSFIKCPGIREHKVLFRCLRRNLVSSAHLLTRNNNRRKPERWREQPRYFSYYSFNHKLVLSLIINNAYLLLYYLNFIGCNYLFGWYLCTYLHNVESFTLENKCHA